MTYWFTDAVCYTEIPETWGLYASQRNRWQRGTIQALVRNWPMIGNPRYGWTGLFGMPFFVIFEAASAIVEFCACVLMIVTLILGLATVGEVLLMLFLAYKADIGDDRESPSGQILQTSS
ncbi:MAG: glycosyltransferase family 2 protein [Terrimicrobiaceae bacterium]